VLIIKQYSIKTYGESGCAAHSYLTLEQAGMDASDSEHRSVAVAYKYGSES
jgi:hypothetical protein